MNSNKECSVPASLKIAVTAVIGTVLLTFGILVTWYPSSGIFTDSRLYNLPDFSSWNHTSGQAQWFAVKNLLQRLKTTVYGTRNLSFERLQAGKVKGFDLSGNDVIVFLHIQKTGGTTFEKFLVKHLDIKQPCRCAKGRKRCDCGRAAGGQWLFSRYSTGWSCGLHADWTELAVSDCVDRVLDRKQRRPVKRRYFYTSLLREPVARYVSEYRHVERGATWGSSPHMCNGRSPTPQELPFCYDPDLTWEGVSLDEFLDCPHNLAHDRQTRMLADLTLVNCYNVSAMDGDKRRTVMLQSAKRNLEAMAFFGLLEEMDKSQFMFERTFDLNFRKRMQDYHKRSKSNDTKVTDKQLEKIKHRNRLDLELYAFAKQLFNRRYELLQKTEPLE